MQAINSKFSIGRIMLTHTAMNTIPKQDVLIALERHVQGDWGELEWADIRSNENALKYGGRLISSFQTNHGIDFQIITEPGRSITIIRLTHNVNLEDRRVL